MRTPVVRLLWRYARRCVVNEWFTPIPRLMRDDPLVGVAMVAIYGFVLLALSLLAFSLLRFAFSLALTTLTLNGLR